MADGAATNAVCPTCPFRTESVTYKMYKGQRYVWSGDEPYMRRDGAESVLSVWWSHCADCGSAFAVKTMKDPERFQPNRRCDHCKKPGRRV